MDIKEKMLNWADNFPQEKEIHLNKDQFEQYLAVIPMVMRKMKMYQFMSRDNRVIRVYYKKDAEVI